MTSKIVERAETVELARDTLVVAHKRAKSLGLSLSEYLQTLIARDAQTELTDPWREPVPTKVEEQWKQDIADFDAEERVTPRPDARTVAEFREQLEQETAQFPDDEEH